jgi:Uri superfamily endonuclease
MKENPLRQRLRLGEAAHSQQLPQKGIYTLLIFLENKEKITVGKLGPKVFWPGHYSYTGSAVGNGATSLPNRVSRHYDKAKPTHWHIDFLLASQNAHIIGVDAVGTQHNMECQANQLLRNRVKNAKSPIPKFGATDCRNECKSHLLYFGNKNIKRRIRRLYQQKFGESSVFLNTGFLPHSLS